MAETGEGDAGPGGGADIEDDEGVDVDDQGVDVDDQGGIIEASGATVTDAIRGKGYFDLMN